MIENEGEKPPKSVSKWYKKVGSKGGKARAARYSKAQLSAWAKKGGRPRKKKSEE